MMKYFEGFLKAQRDDFLRNMNQTTTTFIQRMERLKKQIETFTDNQIAAFRTNLLFF